jgi:hypothetical protein
MSGTLGLSSPWSREAIRGEDRLDIESLIPDGWTLGVSVTPNRAQVRMWLLGPDGSQQTPNEYHAYINAVLYAKLLAMRARELAAGPIEATYEHGGFVVELLENRGAA